METQLQERGSALARRMSTTWTVWGRHLVVIGSGLAVMGGSLLALDRQIVTGTAGETAIVVAWTAVLLAAGAHLRHWSLLAFPAAAFVAAQVLMRQSLAHPPPGAGTPPPGVAWMVSLMAAVVVGFLPLGAWCAARMFEADGHRRRRLTILGMYGLLVTPVAFALMWGQSGALFLAILILVGVAGYVVNRYDAVPVISLIAWLAIYGAGAIQGIVAPPEYPGETPLSAFLESPVFVIGPTLIVALGGAFLHWGVDAQGDDIGTAPAGA